MTPFGAKLRALRASRGMTQAEMAEALQVSAAYLSALEHGRRGRPTMGLVHQVCDLFGLIWDDAEELVRLAKLSHPRVVVDTAGLDPARTELANRLAREIARLPDEAVRAMLETLERAAPRRRVRVRARR
ncbi:helix-turn-helix domain-containing protein [Elioraea tepida]|jgi:transcriptional regulator with XRE-family HTH domain|uniref:Helix-turn-helix domain-containing protein n=1 Tax=Elioraea tepida TaxID=2843330 RepID=A0A975YKT8_9PROT|nr:helix-turn-helix domain-containing protein [Elioraea tepida]QXM26081.1 helix-turn-helix domain-containing protein [Elioraea tepida]